MGGRRTRPAACQAIVGHGHGLRAQVDQNALKTRGGGRSPGGLSNAVWAKSNSKMRLRSLDFSVRTQTQGPSLFPEGWPGECSSRQLHSSPQTNKHDDTVEAASGRLREHCDRPFPRTPSCNAQGVCATEREAIVHDPDIRSAMLPPVVLNGEMALGLRPRIWRPRSLAPKLSKTNTAHPAVHTPLRHAALAWTLPGSHSPQAGLDREGKRAICNARRLNELARVQSPSPSQLAPQKAQAPAASDQG